jgi:hypothetical protein
MKMRNVQTGDEAEAMIALNTEKDFKAIKKDSDQFKHFDWSKCKNKEVYNLKLAGSDKILGVMCIVEHTDPQTDAIEIELLEIGIENVGKGKKLDNIAGCLIAFACRESFKRGHEGYVFLTPKSELIKHYHEKYGLYHWPVGLNPVGIMISEGQNSIQLIRRYL